MRSRVSARASTRLFFVGFAIVSVALVVAGFSRTFFVPVAHGTFDGPLTLYVHASFFLAWISLLVAQASLAYSRNLGLHRRLGLFSLVLIPAMTVSGIAVSLWATARDLKSGQGDVALAFLLGLFMDVTAFAVLATLAVAMRRRAQVHKRLIVFATLALLGPALIRIPIIEGLTTPIFIALLLSVVVYDLLSLRRVHAATIWGGGGLFVSGLLQVPLGETTLWLSAAKRIMALAPY